MEPKLPDFHRDQKCLALTLFVSAGGSTTGRIFFPPLYHESSVYMLFTGAIWAKIDSIVSYCPPRAVELSRKSLVIACIM